MPDIESCKQERAVAQAGIRSMLSALDIAENILAAATAAERAAERRRRVILREAMENVANERAASAEAALTANSKAACMFVETDALRRQLAAREKECTEYVSRLQVLLYRIVSYLRG